VEILPNFFRHSRFQSLVRQLNFYAFKKVSKERSSWVYSHVHFQQHHPELLEKLRRKTNGIAVKRVSGFSQGSDGGNKRKKRRLLSSNDKYSSDESSDENYEGVSMDHRDSFSSSEPKYWVDLRYGDRTSSTDMDDSAEDEIDSGDDSDEVNYENIHRSWDNVHQYFTDSVLVQVEEVGSTSPLPSRAAPEVSSSYADESIVSGGVCVAAPPGVARTLTAPPSLCLTSSVLNGAGSADQDYLCRLVSFCSVRNPWEQSQELFADIHSLLTEDEKMTRELNAYVSALSPSSLSCRSTGSAKFNLSAALVPDFSSDDAGKPHVSANGGESSGKDACPTSSLSACILRANEVTVVRNFMAFALACMHELAAQQLADHVDSPRSSDALSSCADRWARYARVCS
ncbi:HSFA3, partial [Symbiodinium microadriaticum]